MFTKFMNALSSYSDKKKKARISADPDLVEARRRRRGRRRRRESLGAVYERTVLKLFRKKDK